MKKGHSISWLAGVNHITLGWMCPQLSYPQITDSYPSLLERYLKPKLSRSSRIRTLDRWEVLFCRRMLNRYSISCWALQVTIFDLAQGFHIPDEKVESHMPSCPRYLWLSENCWLVSCYSSLFFEMMALLMSPSPLHMRQVFLRFLPWSFKHRVQSCFNTPLLHIIIPVFFMSLMSLFHIPSMMIQM